MLKDWNFWERNFAECVLTVYRLPMKKTQCIQPSGKLPYTTFDKVTNKWPREYRSRFWIFCYRLNKLRQDVFVINTMKLLK